ncbi:phage portal protein [Micromonospora sp. DT47]|uniref:phage portal protein n=1 Tax=Micromonospora sp. DT47 TaxID=3393431 RepID=UPI003CEBA202
MALPDTEAAWVDRLARLHETDLAKLRELNSLYEGTAPLHYLHPEILREVGDRIKAVALGWPMLAVDPLEERLDVLGFRYPEDDDQEVTPEELASLAGDKNLQRVWLDNELDTESQLGHVDALVMKRAYIAVGANEGDSDTPLVTVESPLELFAEVDPRTRATRGALRRWADGQDSLVRTEEEFATLYLPNATIWYDRGQDGWREQGRDEHNLGEVPIVPLVNRGRLADRYGRSELTEPLLSLSHAANKIATDMMVAAEFHAIPLRAIFGIGPDDLVDQGGNRMSALQVILGRLLTIQGDGAGNEVKPFEFTSSSLSNFHATLDQLAKHTSGLLGLDPGNFGITTSNPASADSIRAREARAVKRAERKQRGFGGSWRKSQRLVLRFQEGDWDPRAKRLETIWRDAATPTRAQAADAAMKLLAEGAITKRQTREDLGYTPGQIRRMEAEDEQAAERDPIAELARAQAVGAPPVIPEPE